MGECTTIPRFSVCIPNYNYARYLGETVASVLDQSCSDLEVRFSDNGSTDESVDVIKGFSDERIHVSVNSTNVGMSSNFDLATRDAAGQILLLLSSDDLMHPGALQAYDALFGKERGPKATIVSSLVDRIDGDGNPQGTLERDPAVWAGAVPETELSLQIGRTVLSIDPKRLLRQCMMTMSNPFSFAATAYSRDLYAEVGGYLGGRSFGPDKWFHWRILAKAERVFIVDEPLFDYRWHDSNQAKGESSIGSLKYLVDEYLNTIEMTDDMLADASMTRAELRAAFIEHDIARHGFATLARGDHVRARRVAAFGRSTYPSQSRRNPKVAALSASSMLGSFGVRSARLAKVGFDHLPKRH